MNGIKIYEFQEKDFDMMFFDVHKMSEKENVLVRYSVLTNFPEFTIIPGLNLNKVFKYIAFMYDWRSPLRSIIEDWKVRKYNAMLLAGYNIDENGDFPPEVNEVMMNDNIEVVRMIFRYARITMGELYMELIAQQAGYQSLLEKVAVGDSSALKDRARVRNEIDNTLDRLLSQDTVGNAREKFLDYIDMDTLGVRPEDIARDLQDNKTVLVGINPYGLKRRVARLTLSASQHEKDLAAKYGFVSTR